MELLNEAKFYARIMPEERLDYYLLNLVISPNQQPILSRCSSHMIAKIDHVLVGTCVTVEQN